VKARARQGSSSEASTCPVHSDCQAVSRERRVNGTLDARPRCNPGQAAFGVRGTGCAGGTALVFSIAILVTMNTPKSLSQNEPTECVSGSLPETWGIAAEFPDYTNKTGAYSMIALFREHKAS
jgi:hypothetical protein